MATREADNAPVSPIDALRERLALILPSTPALRVILFGSRARGEADQYSDTDLIIVSETTRPFPERFKDFMELIQVLPPPVELLVYTPAEFSRMLEHDNGFLAKAVAEGVVLYEKAR